jgi:hypothetical protein
MKQLVFLLKSACLAGVLALAFAGCSKEEGNKLDGKWTCSEVNLLFYMNGQTFNVKDENPSALEDMNATFRGIFFRFNNGSLTMGKGNESSPAGSYTVSGDKITIRDGSTSFTIRHAISGKNMDLIFDRAALKIWGGISDAFDEFDDVEAILSFRKS